MGCRTVLVTGASSGIGAAVARRIAHRGHAHIFLVARRSDKLKELAFELESEHVQAHVIAADLTTETGIEIVTTTAPEVDILINNAGFGGFGRFSKTHHDDAARMIALNCQAPIKLTRHYLPGMQARGKGSIVMMASAMGFQAVPFMTTYAATKAFLINFAEGLREEVRGTGVHVGVVCPGATHTEFNTVAQVPGERLPAMRLVGSSMQQVVDATMAICDQQYTIRIAGLHNRLILLMGKFAPRWLSRRLLAFILGRAVTPKSER